MARGVNKAILVGHLGNDPEVKHTTSGSAVANVSLATTEQWKDKGSGERQERTEWHRLVFFGRLAEIAGEYLRKGSLIYVEGRLQTREWEKDGVKRYSTEIVVNDMQMLGGGQQGDRPTGSSRPAQQQAPAQAPAPGGDPFDDEIPFGPKHWMEG